jgi:hypothetical protein
MLSAPIRFVGEEMRFLATLVDIPKRVCDAVCLLRVYLRVLSGYAMNFVVDGTDFCSEVGVSVLDELLPPYVQHFENSPHT